MRKIREILLTLLAGILVASCAQGGEKLERIEGKKVLMIIASTNFRDEEYKEPREILEAQGAKVTVASSTLKGCRGMLGLYVQPDILLNQVKVKDYDGILFIGGSGASEYWDSKIAHEIAQEAVRQDKVLGAICIAPLTLANAGVLKGKRATVWPSEGIKIRNLGAQYIPSSVQVDGKIITADGPKSAKAFGEAIVKALSGK
ncbi:DJ-1/PfpI family protein [bacterium]|nr:DJ-1/PfpI family protein [bacterium]